MADYPAPDMSPKQNFDSMKHIYSLAAPKEFVGTFRTHTSLYSSRQPTFSDTFVPLSKSGDVEKWLAAGKPAAVTFFDGYGKPTRREVPHRSVVLCERRGDSWVLQIPGAGAWAKPYSGSACEKSVDCRTEAMLARDFVRSAAIHESQVSDSNKAGI
jgi:hypothetical protein